MYEGKERELKPKRPIGLVRSGRSGSRRLRERLVLSVLVVLALAGAVVACPAPSALASSAVSNTLQLGTPEHTKYVTANSDGTYGLHLTFTGESAKRSGADVDIVLDESNSMFAKQIVRQATRPAARTTRTSRRQSPTPSSWPKKATRSRPAPAAPGGS